MKELWCWFVGRVWGWLYAAWLGLLAGLVVGGLLTQYLYATALFVAGLTVTFTIRYERDKPSELPHNFSHGIAFCAALIVSYWFMFTIYEPIFKKAERYESLMEDWEAGFRGEAIQKLDGYHWSEKHSHQTHVEKIEPQNQAVQSPPKPKIQLSFPKPSTGFTNPPPGFELDLNPAPNAP